MNHLNKQYGRHMTQEFIYLFYFIDKMILNYLKRALSISEKVNDASEINNGSCDPAPCDEAADIELKETIYDLIKNIRDPEKPSSLEDLHVVAEEDVFILHDLCSSESTKVRVEFNPTVPHCSLATLIGLCIRVKLQRCLPQKIKLDIYIKKGTHDTEEEINKQVNDKERIAAAMENEKLRELVEQCIADEE